MHNDIEYDPGASEGERRVARAADRLAGQEPSPCHDCYQWVCSHAHAATCRAYQDWLTRRREARRLAALAASAVGMPGTSSVVNYGPMCGASPPARRGEMRPHAQLTLEAIHGYYPVRQVLPPGKRLVTKL